MRLPLNQHLAASSSKVVCDISHIVRFLALLVLA
jgi:hypothetical protein